MVPDMRFRDSLRALLLLTIAAGVGFGAYLKWTEHERNIAALEKIGAICQWVTKSSDDPYRPLTPAEQYAEISISGPFDTPQYQDVRSWKGQPADFQRLRSVRRLNSLAIDDQGVNPSKLEGLFPILPELPVLESLTLGGPILDDQAFSFLKDCRALRTLAITQNTVFVLPTSVGPRKDQRTFQLSPARRKILKYVQRLPELTQLRSLELLEDSLDAEAVCAIGKCRALKSLTVSTDLLTGSWRPLRELTALEVLSIGGRGIDESDLPDLPPGVKHLSIALRKVSSRSVEECFRPFTKLETLDVSYVENPKELAQRLHRMNLPRLRRLRVFGVGQEYRLELDELGTWHETNVRY